MVKAEIVIPEICVGCADVGGASFAIGALRAVGCAERREAHRLRLMRFVPQHILHGLTKSKLVRDTSINGLQADEKSTCALAEMLGLQVVDGEVGQDSVRTVKNLVPVIGPRYVNARNPNDKVR